MNAYQAWLLAGAAAFAPAAASAAQPAEHRFQADHVLGTSLEMVAVTDSPVSAALAYSAARAEIARLDKVLSTWRPDSEISQLNAKTALQASPDLMAVISSAEDWRVRSGGAFSARLGTVETAWRQAALNDAAPGAGQLRQLASDIAGANVTFSNGAIQRPANISFAVDGIAKGYIIDAALEAAQRAAPGLRGLMVDIGGDVRCSGASPTGAWTIGVAGANAADNAAPVEVLRISNKAVATSGMGKRDNVIGGCAYSQTLSPFDGSAVKTPQVTVVADKAADADALASALSVLSPREGLALIGRTPGAQARIVSDAGEVFKSGGWNALLTPVAANRLANLADCAAAPAVKAWPTGFSVNINYQIPVIDGPRVKTPFVVIWVTDSNNKIVRTLFHLGNRPDRFLDSNYVWYQAFQAQTPSLFNSITRPSRAPGKYDAEWDGKDDSGKAVPQGEYTISIEAAREHGGHSLQQIKLTLGADAVESAKPAGGELGAITVKYAKKP